MKTLLPGITFSLIVFLTWFGATSLANYLAAPNAPAKNNNVAVDGSSQGVTDSSDNPDRQETNAALDLLQAGNPAAALPLLTQVLDRSPNNFSARLARALTLRALKQEDNAQLDAQYALKFAPDEAAREITTSFIEGRPPTLAASQASQAPQTAEDLSGKKLEDILQVFFSTHPIIGPKLKSVTPKPGNIYEVMVSDFPVQAMPDFAKQKLEQRIAELLEARPAEPGAPNPQIQMIDSETKVVLMTIHSNPSEKPQS